MLIYNNKISEMKKKIYTKINEYLNNQDDVDMIVEMARINDKNDLPYDVFVYGGNSYGSGRNEHGEPHFHFSDNIKKPKKFKLSVLIPETVDWGKNRTLTIISDESTQIDWSGLKKERNLLLDWMDKPNKYDNTKTNYQFIKIQWNVLNSDNKNVRQIVG